MYFPYLKRFADITASLLLLVTFSWLFILIFLAYTISFSFPVIFKQRRIGKEGKPFTLYKFRSLKDSLLPLEHRRFLMGDFLRGSSIDELPQLINVLKGDMSLVGPRPLPVEYGPLFSAEQSKRHGVRPGITGWAQVSGRHAIDWQKKFELDLYYIEHLTFRLDARIIFKTVTILLSFRKDISLEEEKFMGNA